MMTLRPIQMNEYDGGAAVVAAHVAQMGGSATLITALAKDEQSEGIRARLSDVGVDVRDMAQRRQVVTKHRYLADQTKLFKESLHEVEEVQS